MPRVKAESRELGTQDNGTTWIVERLVKPYRVRRITSLGRRWLVC